MFSHMCDVFDNFKYLVHSRRIIFSSCHMSRTLICIKRQKDSLLAAGLCNGSFLRFTHLTHSLLLPTSPPHYPTLIYRFLRSIVSQTPPHPSPHLPTFTPVYFRPCLPRTPSYHCPFLPQACHPLPSYQTLLTEYHVW